MKKIYISPETDEILLKEIVRTDAILNSISDNDDDDSEEALPNFPALN